MYINTYRKHYLIDIEITDFTFCQPVIFQHGQESCHFLFQLLVTRLCCLVSKRKEETTDAVSLIGWEDWFSENSMNHHADMLIMGHYLYCLKPPVVSLLAPRVTSLPHPPPPRCPALGSSSVCCKPCVPPGHPAMPGKQ